VTGRARILVVDDDPAIRKIVRDRVRARGHEVETASGGIEALDGARSFAPDLVILDLRMPDLDGLEVLRRLSAEPRHPAVLVVTAHGSIETAVKAVRMGACDFIPKPFEGEHLDHVIARVLETVHLRSHVQRLERELSKRHTLVSGGSAVMARALELADRAARSDATVLLTGESGTGKELLARHIHRHSPRSVGPFVAVNCATLSGELLESDLFGHERGAFTGAHHTKRGRIEAAAGGTLFLDEIAELAPALQAKLLRVLQEREFERVGGTRTIVADVRVVAATHADLPAAMAAGLFREDLYYRVNVVAIEAPPLRARPEDTAVLLDYFLERYSAEARRPGLQLDDDARRLLVRYGWPGNVRELSNVIERAVVLAAGARIGVDDLPEEIRDAAPAGLDSPELGYHEAVRRAKRSILAAALRRTAGHQTRAARLLGLTQPYLARLLRNLDVPRDGG
jgi:DNA-binding NtrC family response regulator